MLTVKCKRCAIFGELCALFLVRVVIFVYFCEVGTALRIQNFYVPPVVNMKSSEPVWLECTIEYNSEDNFQVMVAKWFINTTLLYQWSPARPYPYINKKYVEPNSVNRTHITDRIVEIPLAITEKPKDLSGTYRCVVETFLTQDSNESYMKMYAPVENITLNKVYDNATSALNVTCMAKDVYPKPEINLFINDKENITNTELDIEENEREYFDISATYILPDDKLQSSVKINCSIAIPEIRVFSAQTHFGKSGLKADGDGSGDSSGDGSGDGDHTNVDVNANVTEKYDTKGAADWSSKRINFNLLLACTLMIVLFDHFVH